MLCNTRFLFNICIFLKSETSLSYFTFDQQDFDNTMQNFDSTVEPQ